MRDPVTGRWTNHGFGPAFIALAVVVGFLFVLWLTCGAWFQPPAIDPG